MEKINEEYASFALKRFFETATDNIKMSAVINRALTDKISTETINRKVNSELNSIQASMYKINSKFNENSKNYNEIKREILDVLTEYEAVLTEYSDFYDTKLEQLILRKVELESHLIGKIFREENFNTEENCKEKEKQNDKLKNALTAKSKKIFEKFSLKKQQKGQITFTDIKHLEDSFDIEQEQEKKLNKRIEKVQEKNKINISEINGIEKEIKNIEEEIKKINERKRLALEEAMETKDKWISVSIKKPHAFTRITRFFANKFNTSKVVSRTIIEPLKLRIIEFKTNELADIKG